MNRILMITAAALLTLRLLTGCSKPETKLPIGTEPSSVETVFVPETATQSITEFTTMPATETVPTESEETSGFENAVSTFHCVELYAQQIQRYYTAISQQWDENAYWDQEMSSLTAYYYEGVPLDNVGFTFMDLDGDGIQELLIGAILGADRDPLVFELWTVRNHEPIMLAQSGSHNRYYLQYAEEDDLWSVAYEAENGAANHAIYYLQLVDGKFQVIQGIIFDAFASETDPWFMTYDLDWDVSNDTPIGEETATAVMAAGRSFYAAQEYFPYSQYK